MNKKLEFFSSMAVAFIVLILVFLCIRFSGQGKFATHGGTNPSDVKCIYTSVATVYKGNIIKNLIMDCQSYTKYRPNETTGGIFVSWRRKEELPTGA